MYVCKTLSLPQKENFLIPFMSIFMFFELKFYFITLVQNLVTNCTDGLLIQRSSYVET